MNQRTTKAVYVGLIILFLGIIITSAYYLLGGFQEVKVYKVQGVQRTVFGKYFESPAEDAYYDHGVLCRKLVAEGSVSGTLAEVLYLDDSVGNKEGGRFLGIAVEEEMAEIPGDFEVREFTSKARYAVYLSMHPLVMPRPGKVESLMQKRAQAEANDLENFTFTLIYLDNSRAVEWWVKE